MISHDYGEETSKDAAKQLGSSESTAAEKDVAESVAGPRFLSHLTCTLFSEPHQ